MRELTQTFSFPGADADHLADVLATAPLVGEGSIFGDRTVRSTSSDGGVRRVHGFEPVPVPLLRFDVEIRQTRISAETVVFIEFAQPERRRPYLAGQFVWLVRNDEEGAVLQEEINTPIALDLVDIPLHGSGPSLRRWLFFSGGHHRLMSDVEGNLQSLLERFHPQGE